METIFHKIMTRISMLIIPSAVFCLTIVFGYIVRQAIFKRIENWARRTKTQLDDIIIHAIKAPFMLWCVLMGAHFFLQASKLPLNITGIIDKIIFVLGVISVTFVLARIANGLIVLFSSKLETTLPVNTLTQNITRIIIFSIGTLIVLHGLGISIAPILATLGIGGLAVALALQDTLSNLFSGFHISLARQIKVGDYIKLESGEEGHIIDINWRTTKIKMPPNNVVLVPNSKLTQAIITNFHLPDKEIIVTLNLGVHYKSDLNKVERITCEVAKAVLREVPGGVPSFEPMVRFSAFADSSINFTLIMRAKEVTDQALIKHELIKRLHARYNKESIIIPYPIRALNSEQEKQA